MVARCALQSVRGCCSPHGRYRHGASSYGIGCSFRVCHPLKYHRYCFGDPALPLVLTSAVRFSFSGLDRRLFRLPITSSRRASRSSRVLPSNTYPAVTTAESSHGLLLPTALEELEVHCSRASPTRYVPPSGFGYPLDGLLPRIPCRSCFVPAALLGFTLRRFPLPAGFRGVSAERNPRTVNLHVTPAPKCQTGQADLGFWVHTFRKCLATAGFLSRRSLAPPLGFAPSGPSGESLDQDFSRSPLTRFADPAITRRIHRRPRVSVSSRLTSTSLAPKCTPAEATLLGFSHRPHPDRSNSAPPGLLSSPHTGSHITADSPVLFGR
jgi:hypothetical protein